KGPKRPKGPKGQRTGQVTLLACLAPRDSPCPPCSPWFLPSTWFTSSPSTAPPGLSQGQRRPSDPRAFPAQPSMALRVALEGVMEGKAGFIHREEVPLRPGIAEEPNVAVEEEHVGAAGHVVEVGRLVSDHVPDYRDGALRLGTRGRVVDVGDEEPLDPLLQ